MLYNVVPQFQFSMPADRTPPTVYAARPAIAGGPGPVGSNWQLPTMSLRGPISAGAGFWQPWTFRNYYVPGLTSGNYPDTRFLAWRTPNMVTLDTGNLLQCGRGMFG